MNFNIDITEFSIITWCLYRPGALHCVNISTVARFSSTRFGTAQYCLCSHYAVSLAKSSGFHKCTIKYYLVYLLKLDAALSLQASCTGILSFQLDRRHVAETVTAEIMPRIEVSETVTAMTTNSS